MKIINEYQFHKLITSMNKTTGEPVTFKPEATLWVSEENRKKLEKQFNALLVAINDLDCAFHDVIEYACEE